MPRLTVSVQARDEAISAAELASRSSAELERERAATLAERDALLASRTEAERRANVTEQEKEAILRASQDRERYWEERLQTACSEREREALRVNEVAVTSLLPVLLQSTLCQNSVDILCRHLVSSRNCGKRKLTTVLPLRMCRYLWRKGRIERGSATKR